MELEKTLTLPAPPAAVWALLLDPKVMGDCVPGTQAIEVLSPTEYRSEIHVKIAFISAKFKIRTVIVEQRAPFYLRTEGTGEDSAAASSFKQTSEIELQDSGDGQTLMHLKLRADLLGRLGSFGMSIMKTKADRMWDEFGVNLAQRLAPQQETLPDGPVTAAAPTPIGAPASASPADASAQPALPGLPAGVTAQQLPSTPAPVHTLSWWQRLFAPAAPPSGDIHVKVQRGDLHIEIRWPVQGSQDCASWLRDLCRAAP